MIDALGRDYANTTAMIFGDAPDVAENRDIERRSTHVEARRVTS